jgi:Peptidase of plants and bacteria
MQRLIIAALACLLLAVGSFAGSDEHALSASIETTLNTEGNNIRQFAFDGDQNTYFASAWNPGRGDHFTLVFDKRVALNAVKVTTGRPDGSDKLDNGTLEISADGKSFRTCGRFQNGVADMDKPSRGVIAIRVRPGTEPKNPLVIREFQIDSDPPIAVFKYPVEFVIDVSDAPDMRRWAENVARVCEHAYGMINDELRSEGFKPTSRIDLAMKEDYQGVAATSGYRITGSVKYFRAHPNDVGAMVHETVHAVQRYQGRNNPGWLIEGIADYIRFFKYEPGHLGRIDAGRAHYDGSYRVTAAFLAYVTKKYDKELVRKLNKRLREGKYDPEVFRELTDKPLETLDGEWRATLRKNR